MRKVNALGLYLIFLLRMTRADGKDLDAAG